MPEGKYRIRKITEGDPWFAWALHYPDGRLNIYATWTVAIQVMNADAARQAAVRNRIPLAPIGTVNHV